MHPALQSPEVPKQIVCSHFGLAQEAHLFSGIIASHGSEGKCGFRTTLCKSLCTLLGHHPYITFYNEDYIRGDFRVLLEMLSKCHCWGSGGSAYFNVHIYEVTNSLLNRSRGRCRKNIFLTNSKSACTPSNTPVIPGAANHWPALRQRFG